MRPDFSDQHWEWFSFGGVVTNSYGVWISGEDTFPVPERDVEVFEVPGRNGTLSMDNGRWKNVRITYHCFMSGNFREDFDNFRNDVLMKTGYNTLYDTYRPEGYRKARLVGGVFPNTGPYNRSAKFDLTFDCWPQFYLWSGNTGIAVQSGSELTGVPRGSYSRPKVQFLFATGSGNVAGTLTIGDKSISFSDLARPSTSSGPLEIDCENRTIRVGGTDVSSKFTLDDGDFFDITPPSVLVTFTGDILGVSITPRWWTL